MYCHLHYWRSLTTSFQTNYNHIVKVKQRKKGISWKTSQQTFISQVKVSYDSLEDKISLQVVSLSKINRCMLIQRLEQSRCMVANRDFTWRLAKILGTEFWGATVSRFLVWSNSFMAWWSIEIVKLWIKKSFSAKQDDGKCPCRRPSVTQGNQFRNLTMIDPWITF